MSREERARQTDRLLPGKFLLSSRFVRFCRPDLTVLRYANSTDWGRDDGHALPHNAHLAMDREDV